MLIVGSGVLSLLVFTAAFVGGLLEAPFPSDASAPASGEAFLLDAHGHSYAMIKPAEQRVPLASYNDIGQTMVDAIVAAEDERYFSHGGVDPLAILRAAGSDLTGGDPSGASTITQQYVKNVYTNKQRTILRKVKEAALAVRLDRAKSKQEILRLYLNSVYFGNNNYGIEAAAKFYFKKDSKQLDCGEASMLAGLVSAPSAHEPVHHFPEAKIRQHYVLDREVALNMLTAQQATLCYDSITRASILGNYTGPPRTSYPEYADKVTAEVQADFGSDFLKNGNAVVKTPLDEDLQDAAEQALSTVLHTPGDPEGVVVGINPRTGDVTTIATQGQPAGTNGKAGYQRFGLDLATDQFPISGSTVKPFTLAAALQSGKYSLSSTIYGPPTKTISAPGCAQPLDAVNAEDGEGGTFSLQSGLAQSVNTVYGQLAVDVGLDKIKALAGKAGVPTAFDEPKTPVNQTGFHYGFDGTPGTTCPVFPSQSLGIAVSPANLATGYATLINGGTYHPQRYITDVEVGVSGPRDTKGGTALQLPALAPSRRVISASVSEQVVQAMRQVVTDGTAQPTLGQLPFTLTDLVGKTGTTEKENNAWFVGCRPTLCLAVWMGYPFQYKNGQPNSMNGVEGVPELFGGTLPAKIFATTYADYQQNLKQSGQPALTPALLATPSSGPGTYIPLPVATEPRSTTSVKPTGKASPSAKASRRPTPGPGRASAAPSGAPAPPAPPPSTAAGSPTAAPTLPVAPTEPASAQPSSAAASATP